MIFALMFWYLPSLAILFNSFITGLIALSIPYFVSKLAKSNKRNNKNITNNRVNQSNNYINNIDVDIDNYIDNLESKYNDNFNHNYNNYDKKVKTIHSYKKVNLLTKKWSAACEKEFVSLDIETTGLSYENDKIIEITAIRYINFIETEKFSTLINPQIPISSRITKINGITNDMVKDSPTIEKSIKDFYNFIGDSILVAHNASFDMNFLSCKAKNYGLEITNNVIDTLQVCRKLYNFENNKLGTVCKNLNINMSQYHRAESDARACGEVIIKSIDEYKRAS